MRRTPRRSLLLVLLAVTGCTSGIRATTSERTSSELLLISTAAARAIDRFDASPLAGKRTRVDARQAESVDMAFLLSELREHLARAGAVLVDDSTPPEVVLELRVAALGINDPDWLFGIPSLPLSPPGISSDIAILTPEISFGFDPQVAWAKLEMWCYEPLSGQILGSSILWGRAETGWFDDVHPSLLSELTGPEEGS